MRVKDIKEFGNQTASQIRDGELHDAIAAMRAFSEGAMSWEITSRIDRLEDNYRFMLDYFAKGIDDPNRIAVYEDITVEARAICDELVRNALLRETPTLYYNVARTLSLRRDNTIASLAEAYLAEERRLNADYGTIADPRRRLHAEQLMRDLFARVWVTYPLSSADVEALTALIADPVAKLPVKALAIGAVTMGLMEYFDMRRLELLLTTYMSQGDEEVRMRALTGALMAMFRYRNRPLPRRIIDVLKSVKEEAGWRADFKIATLEFIRARDTERINRKMREDIYPTLMKFGPGLQDKIGNGDLDIESLAEGGNPDWEEMLNQDGLGDKLREMSEIQAEGGDVFMSTFSHLKQFPFFNDIANWFMPFDSEQTDVASLDGLDGQLGTLLMHLPFLCNSDKYSVIMSLGALPPEHRDKGLASLKLQEEQTREMMSEMEKADPATHRQRLVNRYLQDLYRFYNLFRRKGEFFNPFDHMINLLEVESIGADFDDVETLTVVAEFCFKHKFYQDAARLFERIDTLDVPDARRAQKRGYCHECTGNNDEAVNAYEEAELLDGGSKWTLRRLAVMMRRIGRPARAVEYYQRLAKILPDDFDVTLNLGYALTEDSRHDEAEAQFHKAVYLNPDSLNARRGLGWVQLIGRKIDRAAESYQELLKVSPTAEDYLNAGHVERARHDMRQAINYYKLSMQIAGQTVDDLSQALDNDRRWLEKAGVNIAENQIIIESIKYQ